MRTVRIPAAAILCAGAIVARLYGMQAGPAPIAFPQEYRNWAHVKSVLIGPDSPAFKTEAGIHHIYANEKALQGYRTGAFPDGSIIVYDLLETTVAQGATSEGAQRRVDVMLKDAQRYPATGGWGFGRFMGTARGESTLTAELQASCFACHVKESDAVFSQFRK